MGVRPAENQTGSDTVLAVRLQEVRDSHLSSVREIAGRWEQGLRGLLAVTGVTGLVGAPLAVGNLAAGVQLAIGILLAVALLAAGVGLTLVMSAAYGSIRMVRPPKSAAKLDELPRLAAERGRFQLVWGRWLAVGALVLFAASIVLAWASPVTSKQPQLRVQTTDDVSYCGPVLDSAAKTIAVRTEAEGRVEVPAVEVAVVDVVDSCREGGSN